MKRPSKLLNTTKAIGFGGLKDRQHQLIAILLLNLSSHQHTHTHTHMNTFSPNNRVLRMIYQAPGKKTETCYKHFDGIINEYQY